MLVECVAEEAERRGGSVLTDLRVHDRSSWLPWTLFFWLDEFEVSANASAPHKPDGPFGLQPTE